MTEEQRTHTFLLDAMAKTQDTTTKIDLVAVDGANGGL